MLHYMKLNPEPFEMIKAGEKTIELRLLDEKRQLIGKGDIIIFENTENADNRLFTKVLKLHKFESFEDLYKNLPLEKCGYKPEEISVASHLDMQKYYPLEKQEKFGVLGIEIKLLPSLEKLSEKDRAELLVDRLEKVYPEAKCSLNYEKPYELLIATRLSAQCTDARVNIVTKDLFMRFPTLQAFADAEIADVEEIVKPCGLFHTKAKSIVELARVLIEKYQGELPKTLEELIELPGIGRKTANLIMGDIYGKPAVVTDTHCIRICKRFGLTNNTEPYKVEKDLVKILPPEKSNAFCHRLVLFGRETCTARSPKCQACPLADLCKNKIK